MISADVWCLLLDFLMRITKSQDKNNVALDSEAAVEGAQERLHTLKPLSSFFGLLMQSDEAVECAQSCTVECVTVNEPLAFFF